MFTFFHSFLGHISDGDDESMSVGRESLSSESSMVVDDAANETGVSYK